MSKVDTRFAVPTWQPQVVPDGCISRERGTRHLTRSATQQPSILQTALGLYNTVCKTGADNFERTLGLPRAMWSTWDPLSGGDAEYSAYSAYMVTDNVFVTLSLYERDMWRDH